MPIKYNGAAAAPVDAPPPPTSGIRYNGAPAAEDASQAPVQDQHGNWVVPAALTALAAGGAYALTRNPGAAMKTAKSAGNALMDVRRMSMLSGMAPIKSFLGNVGGTAYEAIERGSLKPLQELFSGTTLNDAIQTFKRNPGYTNAGPATGITKYNIPGRIMGSLDEASQRALVRAGHTPQEAERAMLQSPIDPGMARALDNPVAEYLVPFRRTPMNQFKEGMHAFAPSTRGQKIALATSLGTGVAEGATIDDPRTQALATAAAGRYGLPTAMAAGVTRALKTGKKSEGAKVISGMSPVSDYSLSEGAIGPMMDPTTVIPKPATIKLLQYLGIMDK